MQRLFSIYRSFIEVLSGRIGESVALLVTRIALAGIFWRSARTKVVEGTALEIDEIQYLIFDEEFGLPVSSDIMVPLTTYAEHIFPIMLVLGLGTRFAALALLTMTLVIQFLVFPEAWWSVHILWVAMAAVLISRGSGLFGLDTLFAKRDKPA